MMRAIVSTRSTLRPIQKSDSATRLNIGGSILENPGVFAAAALRRVDDQRTLAKRDACQDGGRYVDVCSEERERPPVDAAGREPPVDQGRGRRELDRRL